MGKVSLTAVHDRRKAALSARKGAHEHLRSFPGSGSDGVRVRRLGQGEVDGVVGEGIALRAWNSLERDVLVVSDGKTWQAAGMESDARAALSRVREERREVSLAACTRFRGDGLALSAGKPADLYLTRTGQGEWHVLNSGPAIVEVTIGGKRLRLAPGERKSGGGLNG